MLAMAEGGDNSFCFPSGVTGSRGVNSPLSCRDLECCGDSAGLRGNRASTPENLASSSVVKGGELSSSNSDGQDWMPDLVDSLETEWTNEKHCSYLDSIEASFVKKMYDSGYCALDLCGRAPKEMKAVDPDSAESRLNFPSPFNEFKIWQKGRWQTPPAFNSQEFMFPTVVGSTWVQHFRKPTSYKTQGVPIITIDESWRNSPERGSHRTSKTIENVPCAGRGIYAWHNRLRSYYSGSANGRRKPSTAYDGNFASVEATDCNFKDEAKSEEGQQTTLLEANRNFEDNGNLKKAKVGVDGGCRSREDQVVPFLGSANTNEAGDCNYPSKVQGLSGDAHQHSNGSINFSSRNKPGRTSLKHKQLSGGDACNFGKNGCFDKDPGCDK